MCVLRQAGSDIPAALPFHRYLAPELVERIIRDAELPAYVVARECDRLRADLRMAASLLPYPLVQQRSVPAQPAGAAPVDWQGSLLLASIDGLALLVERLAPAGIQGATILHNTLNRLLDIVGEVIHSHCGGIFGFGLLGLYGDQFIAFFDHETLGDTHACAAGRAALVLQSRSAEVAHIDTPAGHFELSLRIGIASGTLQTCLAGDPEGLALLFDTPLYQRAQQAAAAARPCDIVLDEHTAAQLPPDARRIREGFARLHYLQPATPRVPNFWGWEHGSGAFAELQALIARLDAFRPCLPAGLAALLQSTGFPSFSGSYHSATVLAVFCEPLPLLPVSHLYRDVQTIVRNCGGIMLSAGPGAEGGYELIAVFGALLAHEDDAWRAMRAAAELRAAVRATETPDVLRIGISSDLLFTTIAGNERRRVYVALGPALAAARELARRAPPTATMLARHTQRLIERQVIMHQDRRPLHAASRSLTYQAEQMVPPVESGIQEPVERAPLVGRNEELALLREALIALRAGRGSVVALIGDPGAGKTRLIEELLGELQIPASVHSLFVDCQGYEQHVPFAALRQVLQQIVGIAPDVAPAAAYRTTCAYLQRHLPASLHFAPLLADVLGYSTPQTPVIAALDNRQRRERLAEMVESLLRVAAQAAVPMLVVDDLHWADGSSCEVFARLASHTADLPLLLLLSYRSRSLAAEPWREQSDCRIIELHDLSVEQSNQLAAYLLGARPPADLSPLLEQSHGNPFFIEELVWNLIEQQVLTWEHEQWQMRASFDKVALPPRIEPVIAARIARLSEAEREAIQAAAVIGQRFSRSALKVLLNHADDVVERLDTLERSDLIRRAASGYTFRHAIVRDVAYSSIPRARRITFHRRTVAWLGGLAVSHDDQQAELLAHHSLLAEEWDSAFHYHMLAGRRARRHHATHEALALFELAAAIVPRLKTAPRDELQELFERLGYIYALLNRNQEALDMFGQAISLAQRQPGQGDVAGLIRLHRHIAGVHERRAEYETAFSWLERGLDLTGEQANQEQLRCLLLGAGIYQRQGRYAESLDWSRRSLKLAEKLAATREQAHALTLLAGTHIHLGESSPALQLARQSLALFRQVEDLAGQVRALINIGNNLSALGRWPAALEAFQEAADLVHTIGSVQEYAVVSNNIGDVLRGLGDLDGAIVQYERAQLGFQQSAFGSGVAAMNLGAAYLQQGYLDAAEQQFQRSRQLFATAGTDSFLPELLRYQAELALVRGRIETAIALCHESLACADRLSAQLEEGATRRVLGNAIAAIGNLEQAEQELLAGLAALREADSRYEIARTLLDIADLKPRRAQHAAGSAAFAEAVTLARDLGARLELQRATAIAARWKYVLPE
jgi:predicted ATPase